jgi:glycerol-1-phosphatase
VSEQVPLQALLCDLDGVVYRGGLPCPGAVEGLARARAAGLRILFLTNNAGHTPEGIAAHLRQLGVAADPDEVLTSSMVAADHLAHRLESGAEAAPRQGSAVLAVGGPGVRTSLERAGVPAVSATELADGSGPPVWAVVQGYGRDVCVQDLTEATYAIRAGAQWIATNTDATLPSERGLAPGNGSLLAAVATATGRDPDLVVGKPHAPAYEHALRLLQAPPAAVLAVGDRLETDIEGARRAGLPTVLVTTGVHGPDDVAAAPPERRPDRIIATLLDLDLDGAPAR